MKRRLLLLIGLGVSFAPAVFADDVPTTAIAGRTSGEMKMAQFSGSSLPCDYATSGLKSRREFDSRTGAVINLPAKSQQAH